MTEAVEDNEVVAALRAMIFKAIMKHPELSDSALAPIVGKEFTSYLEERGQLILAIRMQNVEKVIKATRDLLKEKGALD